MASIADIWASLRGDGTPLLKDAKVQGAKAGDVAAKGFKDRMKKGLASAKGGILEGLGLGVGFGAFNLAAKGIQKVTDAIFTSIDAASDLNEAQSKNTAVFRESSDEMEEWAETASEAFGQSKRQALEAAGTFGNLIQAFGIGADKAAEMSKAMVELASDLASFNNTSVDDALEAIRSGLSGETEPLKRYGVALNDVRLKEEALRLGLIETTKGVLPIAIKTQAAYSLILKDTSIAQGDFARTSDGLANTQKTLTAQLEELQAEIGQKLLPVMLELATTTKDDVIPALMNLVEVIGFLTDENEGLGLSLADIPFLGTGAKALEFANAERKAAKEASEMRAAVDRGRHSVWKHRDALDAAKEPLDSFREKVKLARVAVDRMTDALRDNASQLNGEMQTAITSYYDTLEERRRANEVAEEISLIRREARGREFTADEKARLRELGQEQAEVLATLASKGDATMAEVDEQIQKWLKKSRKATGAARRDAEATARAWLRVKFAIQQAAGAYNAFGDRGANGGSSGRPGSGRAAGGPVHAGRPYTVGERGREWFVPSVDGTIIPNHTVQAMESGVSGGGGVTANVYAYGTAMAPLTPGDIARRLKRLADQGYYSADLDPTQRVRPFGEELMVADLHPFQPHGLAFDGVELVRADLSVVMWITYGFFEQWEVRGEDTVIPQVDGQLRRNRKRNRLPIGLAGFVQGIGTTEATDRTAFETLALTLRTLFDPTAELGSLVTTLTNGTQYAIDCRTASDGIAWGSPAIPSRRDLTVELFSISPQGWVEVEGS